MQPEKFVPLALRAASAASHAILEVYHSDNFQTESKGDNSPLTLADKNAHAAIVSILQSTQLPVLSEEGMSMAYATRRTWDYFWMVDPLDGTKEFIKRNGEFTVNIALIKSGKPLLGVVAVPVTGETFFGGKELGCFLEANGTTTKLPSRSPIDLMQDGLRVVASRSHMNKETEQFIGSLNNPSLRFAGSSLKFMLLASGKADIYPRFAPTMEWDTAAAHAVLTGLNIKVLQQGTSNELVYNKPDLLNPWFVVHP